MVVDAQVDGALPGPAVRGRDDERARLAPAGVAAARLGGVQRGEQAPGERARGGLEGVGHGRPDVRRGHHVGLDAELAAALVAGVGDAALAGVGGHVAVRVDHRDLPEARQLVVGHQLVEGLAGPSARRQGVERARAVGRLGDRLGGHRPHSGPHPGDDRPDREPVRLHGDTELCGPRIASDDRVRAAPDHRARAYRRARWPPPSASSTACEPSRRASCAPTATSRPARRARRARSCSPARTRRPVASRRARRRLAGQGRAPARAARGRGRALPRGARGHGRGAAAGLEAPRRARPPSRSAASAAASGSRMAGSAMRPSSPMASRATGMRTQASSTISMLR